MNKKDLKKLDAGVKQILLKRIRNLAEENNVEFNRNAYTGLSNKELYATQLAIEKRLEAEQ